MRKEIPVDMTRLFLRQPVSVVWYKIRVNFFLKLKESMMIPFLSLVPFWNQLIFLSNEFRTHSVQEAFFQAYTIHT